MIYWVIESSLNNQTIYWTGNIPHLSLQQSEAGLDMWTTNIHEALKMNSKDIADRKNVEFEIDGEVREHMDI